MRIPRKLFLIQHTIFQVKKEVRIFDNMRTGSVFKLDEPAPAKSSELEERMEVCEKKIDKAFKYLTSFGGGNE